MPENLQSTSNVGRAIAVDTAGFQAADSYIEDPSMMVDPFASYAFERITSAYCGGARLFYPLPGQTLGNEPHLLRIWKSDSQDVPQSKLTDQAFKEIGERLAPGFMKFMEGTSSPVAQWLAFQFTERIVDQYLSRASIEDVGQSANLAGRLIADNRIPKLLLALDALRSDGKLREPPKYMPYVGTLFDSANHLAVSYILSVYLRAPAYGWRLNDLAEHPIYHHLWLRAPALRDAELIDERSTIPTQDYFPWGPILAKIFDPKAPLLPRVQDCVGEALMSLRTGHSTFLKDMEALRSLSWSNSLWGKRDDLRTEAEDLVIKELLSAGMVVGYRKRGLEAALMKILRFVASFAGSQVKVAVDQVTTNVPSNWIHRNVRSAEANLRLSFHRDTFWDVFVDDLLIRDTVNAYLKKPDDL
jgi:hypothetical protein